MNVVKIMGGLGNQLFQYALSRHLAQYDSIAYDITKAGAYNKAPKAIGVIVCAVILAA